MISDLNDKLNKYNTDGVMSLLLETFGMRLTTKGSGESLDFPESTLSLHNGFPASSPKHPVLTDSIGTSSPRPPAKHLDPFSPDCPAHVALPRP